MAALQVDPVEPVEHRQRQVDPVLQVDLVLPVDPVLQVDLVLPVDPVPALPQASLAVPT